MPPAQPAYDFHRPVENTTLVRQRDRRRLRELLLVPLAVVPLLLSLLLPVWLRNEVLESGYRTHALELRLEDLRDRARRLELEVAYLSGPQRVEEAARRDLGLIQPQTDQIVFAEELP